MDGSVSVQHTGGGSPFIYNWSNGMTSRDISSVAAGNYTVTITDANNCSVVETAVVELLTTISLTAEVKNASCPPVADGEIALTVSGGTGTLIYSWSNGNSDGDIENLLPGNYSATVTDANGCTIAASFSIAYDYVLSVNVTASGSDTILKGESVTLNAVSNGSGVDFSWTSSSGLDCSTCASPVATPLETTTYMVVATSLTGCTAADSVLIVVIERENVFSPGGFTPNGDGINDEFALNGAISDIETFYVVVYDRWGEKLFDSYDPDFRWNGIFKGKELNPGVYVYHMKYKLKNIGRFYERKGSVTLIR
jgi:gliding motility-associated-like protein